MRIDYYAQLSGLRKYNSFLKVLFALANIFIVIFFNKITLSVTVLFLTSVITLCLGRIPVKTYIKFMCIPLAFIILSCLAICLEFSSQPADGYFISLHFFYAGFTGNSIMTALKVFFRAMAGISSLYMLSLSTPVNEIVMVTERLHLPVILTELMNLIYRFIFILMDTAAQMHTSAKARLGFMGFRSSCRSFALVCGSLFISALKKSQDYYDALLSRGYDGRLEFLSEQYPVRLWQIALFAVYFAFILLTAKVGV